MVNMEEFLPIETHHGEDGAKLYDKCEGMDEGVALLYSQQVLCDNHVSC